MGGGRGGGVFNNCKCCWVLEQNPRTTQKYATLIIIKPKKQVSSKLFLKCQTITNDKKLVN